LKREIEKILDDQFKKVKSLLAEYREPADEIIKVLLQKDDIMGDDAIEIVRQFEERTGRTLSESADERTEEDTLTEVASALSGTNGSHSGAASPWAPKRWSPEGTGIFSLQESHNPLYGPDGIRRRSRT
jgi:hypothetical protein